MKLTQIDLKGFRSYKALTLDLNAPRILVAGLNGTGKTGLLNAIMWALTGHCEGTDARGAGADVLISTGLQTAQVIVDIAGIGAIQRAYSAKTGSALTVDRVTGTAQIQQQAIFAKLGTSPAFLEAVLSPDVFLALGHAEAKALILSLLDIRITVPGQKEPVTLDGLDALYKQAFDERRIAKKVLASHVLPVKPEMVVTSPIEAIDAQLQKLRGQHDAVKEAVGQTLGRYQTLTEERDRLKRQTWSLADGPDLTEQIAAVEADIAELEAALVPQAAPAAVAPVGSPQRLQFLRSTVAALQAHQASAGCGFDPEGVLPCKTPQKAFIDRLATLNAELRSMDPKPAPELPANPLTGLRKELASLREAASKRAHALQGRAEVQQRIADIEAEIAALPETVAQEQELATLQARITKGQELRNAAAMQAVRMQAYDAAVEEHARLEAEATRLETLVDVLGPKGIRVKALEEARAKFEAAVNPYVEPFGWTITFNVEPWEVLANNRSVETYSRSERYRIGIALQLAIAQLSGLNFAVIDEVDMLDVRNRAIVSKMLMTAPLEQIIILGTREPSQPLPKVSGALAYRLAVNAVGTTEIAERSVA